MKQFLNNSPALHGTAGGAAVGFLVNIGSGDMLRTTVLAALGTVVSFFVSLGLRLLISKCRKRE
jgi:hypothetical protein